MHSEMYLRMYEDDDAIGIFDSGVGGLTVARRITELLPEERLVYLGDTARVPYGTKSPATVTRYAVSCARLLMERGIKLLVVACNTASAHALDPLRDLLDIPVVGVVEPGARAAVSRSTRMKIGVIGTQGTIASGEYQSAIHALEPDAAVYSKACPLFVPLAEEGWTRGPIPEQIARTYLSDLVQKDIDTLVLGCTHYPLLEDVIREVVGDSIALVDSAEETSKVVKETLYGMEPVASTGRVPVHQFLVSDLPDGFVRLGGTFFGQKIDSAEWVDF